MLNLKVALCGEPGVGKTSIRSLLCKESIEAELGTNFGVDIGIGSMKIDNKKINFQIWDFSGQHSFKIIRKSLLRGFTAGIFVFDLSNPSSLKNARDWINDFWKSSTVNMIPMVIAGNKSDLKYHHGKYISRLHAIELIKSLNSQTSHYGFYCPYLEISAKSNDNINRLRSLLALNALRFMIFLSEVKCGKLKLNMISDKSSILAILNKKPEEIIVTS